jgi:hypothetical protein
MLLPRALWFSTGLNCPSCSAGEYNDLSFGPAIATNTWRHTCITYDGTTARFYQEGVLVASGVPPAGAYATLGASQLVMGASSRAQLAASLQ